MDLGNGSAAVCDGSPANPPGGIPGFDPPVIDCDDPDLTPQEMTDCLAQVSQVTNALVDIACRFTYVTSQGNACTRNPFGDFSYISSVASRQYCFQVPADSRLASGDTVFAVQARDRAGNLGPRREIVVRVP